MYDVLKITDKEQKASITDTILRALPDWFGIESSILEYVNDVKEMPFYVAMVDQIPVGFVAVKVHNEFTCEVYVMGVLQDYHRFGIGRELINCCVEYGRQHKMEFLTVKTLDESRPNKEYEQTRAFYKRMGFKPLEVFTELWGKENPCLFLVKNI